MWGRGGVKKKKEEKNQASAAGGERHDCARRVSEGSVSLPTEAAPTSCLRRQRLYF